MVVQTNTDLVHLKTDQNWFLSLQLAAMEDMRDTLPWKTNTSFVQKMAQIEDDRPSLFKKKPKLALTPPACSNGRGESWLARPSLHVVCAYTFTPLIDRKWTSGAIINFEGGWGWSHHDAPAISSPLLHVYTCTCEHSPGPSHNPILYSITQH